MNELNNLLSALKLDKMTTTTLDIQALINTAVKAAVDAQKVEYDRKITDLTKKFNEFQPLKPPVLEKYEEIRIIPGINCDESLDVVKSLPEFSGSMEQYVSWRQAAHTAYKVFERYTTSSKHYQAVAIIRNKIRGSADAVLASFDTVLNFKAIIARLDFTYADKRPIYLIEQELSTLRQGNLSVIEFFDSIEKKLSLLTNKTTMTYDRDMAQVFNDKYRMDALRTFISGLKKPLCDILFASQPKDLPTALALAQEVESNHERYIFATSFANKTAFRTQNGPDTKNIPFPKDRSNGNRSLEKNPYFVRTPIHPRQPHFGKNQTHSSNQNHVEPMEVDPTSSKFRQNTNYGHFRENQKRQAGLHLARSRSQRRAYQMCLDAYLVV